MPHFGAFLAKTGILTGELNQKSLERVYLAANLSNGRVDYLGKYVKHQNMMTRTQFVEGLCRVA